MDSNYYQYYSAAVVERGVQMKKIIILDADDTQCRALCAILEEENYPAEPARSLTDLARCIKTENCIGVFIDVDTVPVTNRDIKSLALKYPGTYLFCLSKYRFHPELKDAI